MKSEISSVDLHFLIRESQYIVGGKVEKVYESESGFILLHFHVPTKGNVFLRITDKIMHAIKEKEEMPEKPTQFAMILRKKLANARLREFSQLGFERIAVLTFTTKDKAIANSKAVAKEIGMVKDNIAAKDKTFKLIAELFGGGNIILCDEEDKILVAKKYLTFKDRDIKRNTPYVFPERKVLEEKEFIETLRKAERENISKALRRERIHRNA